MEMKTGYRFWGKVCLERSPNAKPHHPFYQVTLRCLLPHPTHKHLAIMDSVGTYATSTAAWLSLQAIPLLISPKLIVTMLSADARRPTGSSPAPSTIPSLLKSPRRSRNIPLPHPLHHPPLPGPPHNPPCWPPAPLHSRR